MSDTVKIRCENNNSEIVVAIGTSLEDILKIVQLPDKESIISAYINNKSKDLNYKIYTPLSVRFINTTHFEGSRVYYRTLFFVLYKAARDLFPDNTLVIEHSISRGFYFEIKGLEPKEEYAQSLKTRIKEIIDSNQPIIRQKYYHEEAEEIFSQAGLKDKLSILSTHKHLYVTVNRMVDVYGYFYGTLAPSTGYLNIFDITPFYNGYGLSIPQRKNPKVLDNIGIKDKMFEVFTQYKRWNDIIDVSHLGSLNRLISQGESSQLIKIAEALQEKLFAHLADIISKKRKDTGVKLILISGPSSSGKTSFTKRLMIQLMVMGLKPIAVSMDDYFVERDKTPLDEKGRPDYESLQAIDLELFNKDLLALIEGENVRIPRFDFHTGKRSEGGELKLKENSVLIVEGIHALNPLLSKDIIEDHKFKVYVSALTSLSMDNLSRISTTDNRLLRRLVRDSKYRNRTALETLKQWGSVRRGEEQNVFPYQEEADYMFNSALFYEISVLKRYAEPLLKEVPDTQKEYSEATRLLNMLDFFMAIDDNQIPPTSILREFIGGSSFEY